MYFNISQRIYNYFIMKSNQNEYLIYAKVLIVMLVLTALNITLATVHHGWWTPGAIILAACIQAFIALVWFMHLRWNSLLYRLLVAGVFFVYLLVIVLLFFDYKLR
jgi:cytochrome c oxidase subunit IV